MEDTLDVRGMKDYMIGYHIVNKIYEIRDSFIFSEEETLECKEILTSLKIIDHISEVNFVFAKDVGILDQIREISKVGNLLNFHVYLDPLQTEDKITIFADKGIKLFELKIQF